MRRRLLALWSVPRARSTAFLRMMVERGDITVVHEPFSRVIAFGRVVVGGLTCRSATEVMQALQTLTLEGPVFFKDTMDKRYPDVLADPDFQRAVTHCFMIRSPEAVVASYLQVAPAERNAIGFENLVELYDAVRASTGQEAFVVDGDQLVADPRRVVEAYCQHVGIAFQEGALHWESGGLEDWSEFARWHEKAATTSGFVSTRPEPLPVELRGVAEAFVAYHRPFYDRLLARIRTRRVLR
jgi:hypothetical protein